MHIKTKINTFANILVRVYDYSTFHYDFLKPTLELMYEMFLLNYKWNDMKSVINVCGRSRKSKVWNIIINLVSLIDRK